MGIVSLSFTLREVHRAVEIMKEMGVWEDEDIHYVGG